jgi:hypothetical protein
VLSRYGPPHCPERNNTRRARADGRAIPFRIQFFRQARI